MRSAPLVGIDSAPNPMKVRLNQAHSLVSAGKLNSRLPDDSRLSFVEIGALNQDAWSTLYRAPQMHAESGAWLEVWPLQLWSECWKRDKLERWGRKSNMASNAAIHVT